MVEVTPDKAGFRAERDGAGEIRLVCDSCEHQRSATILAKTGWIAWMYPGAAPEGELEVHDDLCGGRGTGCGELRATMHVHVPRASVDEIIERRSSEPLPGIIALLVGITPAIVGTIIVLAPGLQTGDEGEEHPVSKPLRYGLGVPVAAVGLGLLGFGIADLLWPDSERRVALPRRGR